MRACIRKITAEWRQLLVYDESDEPCEWADLARQHPHLAARIKAAINAETDGLPLFRTTFESLDHSLGRDEWRATDER